MDNNDDTAKKLKGSDAGAETKPGSITTSTASPLKQPPQQTLAPRTNLADAINNITEESETYESDSEDGFDNTPVINKGASTSNINDLKK